MYRENRKSLNWFVGCNHNCVYCKPSFQRQMKRQKNRCLKCYNYEPHAHLERLLKAPPKTEGDEFIFFPSSGDVAFASKQEFQAGMDYARKYHDRNFLTQSKSPIMFLTHIIPKNVILGTTIETNRVNFNTPSNFHSYEQISRAPYPYFRYDAMMWIRLRHPLHSKILITVEPILDFDLSILEKWIGEIKPQVVYIGYDNHDCRLPEPELAKTELLIESLGRFTEVRVKTLRKAWYEG